MHNGELMFLLTYSLLKVIARFNERRCKGLPLFGQDLIHALFVMKPAAKGNYNATTATSSAAATPSKRAGQSGLTTQGPARSRRPLQTSGSLGYMECINAATPGSSHYRARTSTLTDLVSVSSLVAEDRTGALTCAVVGRSSVNLVPSWSPTIARIERRSKSDLVGLSSNLDLPVAAVDSESPSSSTPYSTSSSSTRGLASESAKLEELDRLLSKFRRSRERSVVFVENPDALFLIRRHLQHKRFPFVYLDGEGRRSERIRQAARFGKRGGGAVCLLTSTNTPASGAASLISGVDNVVFFDVCWDSSSANVGRWIK